MRRISCRARGWRRCWRWPSRPACPSCSAERLTVPSPNAGVKVTALVAGMVAGADSIDDMDLLRHGGDGPPVHRGAGAVDVGHVPALVHVRACRVSWTRSPPGSWRGLPAAARRCCPAPDRWLRRHRRHGAGDAWLRQAGRGFGYSGVNGLNALLGVVSTPTAAPVIAAARLRKGSTNSARGAARLVADTLKTAAAAGADPKTGALVIARMDSAFHGHDVIAAVRRAGAKFSVTARMNPAVTRAIASIEDQAWTPIHYPNAFVDEDTGQLVSRRRGRRGPVFTAFTSRRKHEHVTARLIVRRVKRLNPTPPRRRSPKARNRCSRPSTSGATTRSSPTPRRRCSPPRPPPRPRGRRAGHRRPQGGTAGPPAVGGVQRQRRLARPRLDRVQPAPRRRRPGRTPPRPRARRRHHRDPASPPHHRPGTDRPLRTTARPCTYRPDGPGTSTGPASPTTPCAPASTAPPTAA